MSNWNLADVFEVAAATAPDAACQIQGERVVTWRDFDRRANALAADMIAAGLRKRSKVAAYLYNCPEYLECCTAAFKMAGVPVNTNFRYGPEELLYLWDNADAEAVVFHAAFTDTVEALRAQLPKVKRWYCVADGGRMPEWAVDYEALVAGGADVPALRDEAGLPWYRDGDDMLFLYTGGTTGMPKGVMWRQDDLFNVLGGAQSILKGLPPVTSLGELRDRIANTPAEERPVYMPACPLMHGTGQFGSFIQMFQTGAVVCLPSRKFSADELWATVAQRRITAISIVGDAFARPMLEVLEANPGRYDVSSVRGISSSGVMWSNEVKRGLLKHMPQVTLADSFGSSEAVGMGASASTADNAEQTARFMPGPLVKLLIEEEDWREAGIGERGIVCQAGFLPMGYYKDQEKTDKTFKTIRGVRYSIPGDFAQRNEDGSITLLGRGSVCINTGGEKVFPEEVEEVLKRHAGIKDAVCVGVPDARFGQAICAILELREGAAVSPDDASSHVRSHLAAYKAPRFALTVESIGRAPNGKVDYKGLTQLARDRLGV